MELNVKLKLMEWRRVLQVARKPTKDEMASSTKICAMGIALVGVIGFGIFLFFSFLGL